MEPNVMFKILKSRKYLFAVLLVFATCFSIAQNKDNQTIDSLLYDLETDTTPYNHELKDILTNTRYCLSKPLWSFGTNRLDTKLKLDNDKGFSYIEYYNCDSCLVKELYQYIIGLLYEKRYNNKGELIEEGFRILYDDIPIGERIYYKNGVVDSVHYVRQGDLKFNNFFKIAELFGFVGVDNPLVSRNAFFSIADSLGFSYQTIENLEPPFYNGWSWLHEFNAKDRDIDHDELQFFTEFALKEEAIWYAAKSFRDNNKRYTFYIKIDFMNNHIYWYSNVSASGYCINFL